LAGVFLLIAVSAVALGIGVSAVGPSESKDPLAVGTATAFLGVGPLAGMAFGCGQPRRRLAVPLGALTGLAVGALVAALLVFTAETASVLGGCAILLVTSAALRRARSEKSKTP
jgi:hypothetical protein